MGHVAATGKPRNVAIYFLYVFLFFADLFTVSTCLDLQLCLLQKMVKKSLNATAKKHHGCLDNHCLIQEGSNQMQLDFAAGSLERRLKTFQALYSPLPKNAKWR